ncbi:hypothetical protein PpBr36_01005 [Pyricularia pennisetigena]|uniref:hypothetical protein n=1 Tax=Pyricularia pennisetigena TaxID=1578925 RepID=UPI001152E8A7|nr:hypothetical protein PpBr36_01005 [Pyricularia pennisetigena]TLS28882.1 hypothetical protein PpBr36_01005 [Pyricularia pennisetigena]
MPPSLSDSKAKMVGFDSPERAGAYFLEVLLRLQPYAQAIMIDRSYAPDCSYTHPLFHIPPADLRGCTLPLTGNLSSREALKLLFGVRRAVFPQTVWKTEGSGFDSKSNKVFVLMQHKLDLVFMPRIFNTLHFKVATTLQLKPIYINLDDQAQNMPSESSDYPFDKPATALTSGLDSADLHNGIGDGDRMQDGWKMYDDNGTRNQYLESITSEELRGSGSGSTAYTNAKRTASNCIHHGNLGVDAPLLDKLDASIPTTDSPAGLGESCCCSADAVCGRFCASCKRSAGSGLVLTTRWVICSQEDMMQPYDILLCMLCFPAIVVCSWARAAVYFSQRFKSALLVRKQAKVKALRPGGSAFARAKPCIQVSERNAGPSSAAADIETMDTALLPEVDESAKERAVEKARKNVIGSMANASAHLDNIPEEDAEMHGPESRLENVPIGGGMDANYGMRYMKGNLLAEFNNSFQRASGKSKSVRFTENVGNGMDDNGDTKCDVECKN